MVRRIAATRLIIGVSIKTMVVPPEGMQLARTNPSLG
jgi:hypothetical protein